jgi:hypothetical protein
MMVFRPARAMLAVFAGDEPSDRESELWIAAGEWGMTAV